MARDRGRAGGADPAAHVHPPRLARDAAAGARPGSRVVARARRDVSLGRPPAGAPARRGARPAERLRRARRGRRGGRAGPAARGARARRLAHAVPAQGDPAGHLLAHGECAAAALGRPRAALPLVRGAPRGDLGAVQGLYRPQARARGRRPRRSAAVLASVGGRRGDRPAARRVVRPRADRRVPGRQRPPGRPRAVAVVARAGGDRGRRRLPGHLRLPLGLGGAHPRLPRAFPRHAGGDAGAQLPLDAAGARRRQRARRAGRTRVPETPARGPRGRGAAEGRPRARRGGAGRGGLRPHPRGARAGHGAARPGRAGAHVARFGPARARTHAAPDPVPQVRRAPLPGGRARQGLRRDPAPGRQRRRRRGLVPRAAAGGGRGPGQRAPGDRGDGRARSRGARRRGTRRRGGAAAARNSAARSSAASPPPRKPSRTGSRRGASRAN